MTTEHVFICDGCGKKDPSICFEKIEMTTRTRENKRELYEAFDLHFCNIPCMSDFLRSRHLENLERLK
jgi:hypothetical protein